MADVIGVTGWTPDVLANLTTPALQFILRKRGRILYPRLKPTIDANLANLDNKRHKNEQGIEQKGAADRIIEEYEQRKAGITPIRTEDEQRVALARRILLSEYLGDPSQVDEDTGRVEPIPGLSAASARGLMAWAKSGEMEDEYWNAIHASWLNICASANAT